MYVWRQFFFAIPILGVALVFLDSFFFLFFVSLPIPRKAVFPTDLYWLTCLYDTYDLMVNIKYYDIYATCSMITLIYGIRIYIYLYLEHISFYVWKILAYANTSTHKNTSPSPQASFAPVL